MVSPSRAPDEYAATDSRNLLQLCDLDSGQAGPCCEILTSSGNVQSSTDGGGQGLSSRQGDREHS